MSRIVQLLAVGLPGAYRFSAIFLVGFFFSEDISNEYSRMFFWVGLLTTFSGLAVAAQSYSREGKLSLWQQISIMGLLLLLVSVISLFFWKESYESLSVVLCAAFFLSLFEIFRADLASVGCFKELSFSGIASIILLAVVIILPGMSADTLLIGSFIGLALPLTLLVKRFYFFGVLGKTVSYFSALKSASFYSISNGLSTGLTYIIPLLLINEFGNEYSLDIAKVFSVASLFFLYPRYLSAGFMAKMKINGIDNTVLIIFFKHVFLFSVASSLIYGIASYLYFKDFFTLSLLFFAMQLSQLSLPYSNTLVVLGRSDRLLNINLLSTSLFFILVTLSFFIVDSGYIRGQVILVIFVTLQIARLFLSRQKVNVIING